MRRGFHRMLMGAALLCGVSLPAWAGDAAGERDVVAEVRVDRSVTTLHHHGRVEPVRISLVVRNASGQGRTLDLDSSHLFRLHRTFGVTGGFLPWAAAGTLKPTYGQVFTSVYLGPHQEMAIAVGTFPDDVTTWYGPDGSTVTPTPHLKPGTYVLVVQLPSGLKLPSEAFPGWSEIALTLVEAQ